MLVMLFLLVDDCSAYGVYLFVSVDHPECEACYLEALDQDNYHQGKSF